MAQDSLFYVGFPKVFIDCAPLRYQSVLIWMVNFMVMSGLMSPTRSSAEDENRVRLQDLRDE